MESKEELQNDVNYLKEQVVKKNEEIIELSRQLSTLKIQIDRQ